MNRPLMAITMGDPAGIGPETIVGAWREPALHDGCRAVVVGDPEVLRRAARLFQPAVKVVEVAAPEEALSCPTALPCLVCGSHGAAQVSAATIDPRGGQAAHDAVVLAAELAIAQRVDAIVTAPLNKAALRAAGYEYPGHTELLADVCGASDVAMMLYLERGGAVRGRAGLGVVHVSLHDALRDVFKSIRVENIGSRIRLADEATRRLMTTEAAPRIGVCALNPHGGEQGLFGDEEQRFIRPSVTRAIEEGFDVAGPLPADTLLVRAANGEFDAIVAMYHDQGHIALKLLGMHRAVNITLGLPIIRTSVAHGTAFDLAWQGRAQSRGLLAAARVATKLVEQRSALLAKTILRS